MNKYDYKFFNEIFEPLGYFVINRGMWDSSKSDIFDLFVKDSDKGMEWFGSFSPICMIRTNGKSELVAYKLYVYDNYEVYTPEEVINIINNYNATRICPSFCYCPVSRPFANLTDAFTWYTKSLGFGFPDMYHSSVPHSHVMIYRNIYGEEISRITLFYDDIEKNTGHIVRSIGDGWSWIESPFDGVDEMIAAVNSILEPEMLINAANNLKTTENMSDGRTDNISAVCVDNKSLAMYKANAKNAIKSALQDALNKLD